MRAFTKELLLRSYPAAFSYDHEKGLFTSGNNHYAIVDLPLGFRKLAAPIDHKVDELPDTALVHTNMCTIMLPKMYDWLGSNGEEQLFVETAEVMHDVFTTLRPDIAGKMAKHGSSHFDFNVSLLHSEHPHITLTTLGNCACYGVEPQGIFGERYWTDKIAAFSYHNVDNPHQQVSLLAGLGHIAHRVNSQ